MARLILHLLGPFEAEVNGRPVTFAYKKIEAILAYLAYNLGQSILREKLAGLIWPDKPQKAAFENLRQAISRLKKSINDIDEFPSLLVVDREEIKLNLHAGIQVDVEIFRNALALNLQHVHRHPETCRICVQYMETACQAYRGEFLENLSLPESDLFEDWAAGQRMRLHEQALESMGWLVNFYTLAGDDQAALAYARRRVDLEPFNDEITFQLLKILVSSGKVDQALARFSHFQKNLEDETGEAPSRQLMDYIETLRSGEDRPDYRKDPTTSWLPKPLMPIIGRQVELSELEAWLADPSRRLITLLGPGGIGKTRLAIEIAGIHTHIFADGVIFISFVETDHAANIIEKISNSANLDGNSESELKQKLLKFLDGKDLLLVLDGIEHVVQGGKVITWLLENEPGLVILATSRQRLNLDGEWVFPIGGLTYPPPELSGDFTNYSSTELFVRLACQKDPAFTITQENSGPISSICRLVEGMPLAIKLASAWALTLPCAEIAHELRKGLDLLAAPAAPDKGEVAGMRAVFDQSWNRLSAKEKSVFRKVCVFRGGFDLQAAEAIAEASLDELANLVDKSFLYGSPEGRYDLHDLLLQYGIEKLIEADEVEQISQRHFDYFLWLAEKNEHELRLGDSPFLAFFWLVKEQANLRAAYKWASNGDPIRNATSAEQLHKWMHEELHKTGNHNRLFTLHNLISKF